MIRRPTPHDLDDLARIHVQAWNESYAGLLSAAELAARTVEMRRAQWAQRIETETAIAYAPGLGFSQSGPQRDQRLARLGYPYELYALYLLEEAKGTGLGQTLFAKVRPQDPFTALVIADNTRACRFYAKVGGTPLETRTDRVGKDEIDEVVFVWNAPFI